MTSEEYKKQYGNGFAITSNNNEVISQIYETRIVWASDRVAGHLELPVISNQLIMPTELEINNTIYVKKGRNINYGN